MEKTKKYTEPEKELDIYGEYDVVIVGGGCAGFTAAVAAARNGAKTLIIEQFPYFGGTATASLMGNINGFRNQVEPDGLQTTKGIGEELMLKLFEVGGVGKAPYKHKPRSNAKGDLSYCLAVDTEKFKYISLKMVLEAGVHILFHTYFSDVIKEGDQVKGIVIENKSGRQAIFGKVIIDASGDGDVAFKAGVPYWLTKPNEAHRMKDGLMYKVSNFPETSNVRGCRTNGSAILWGLRPDGNAVDADELTKEEIYVRMNVYPDFESKKAANPELKDAQIVDTGSLIGIRQSRFFEGLYKITVDDVIEGKSFEDSIAMASSPVVEFYGYRRYLEHEGYEIPYRCLLPVGVSNLMISGRCMSSDQGAFESWRAMAHVMAIGEATGTAAALSVKNNVEPKQLNVKLLRKQLIEQGAEIGQGRRKIELD